MPQLELQHTYPTLQVLIPHMTLTGAVATPHMRCEQTAPGGAHSPQPALQQTRPGAHQLEPQATGPAGGSGSGSSAISAIPESAAVSTGAVAEAWPESSGPTPASAGTRTGTAWPVTPRGVGARAAVRRSGKTGGTRAGPEDVATGIVGSIG